MSEMPWRLGGASAGVGAILAAERRRQGISQGELARRLGVAQSNLSRIEKGADLRVSTLLDIARVLQLEPMLVPKQSTRSVRALLDDADARSETKPPKRGRFT
jgi:transcriptional regulator with XRE-family HTH domain